MNSTACIVIFSVLCAACAENVLQNSIFDEEEELPLLRVRRQYDEDNEMMKEFLMHSKYCCMEFNESAMTEEEQHIFRGIEKQCWKQTKNTTNIWDKYFCVFECVLQSFNLTGENGYIQENPDRQTLRKLFEVDDTVVQNMISRCPAWSKEAAKGYQDRSLCNTQSLFFWYCAYDTSNWYCPEDLRIQTESCDEHRENLTSLFQQ